MKTRNKWYSYHERPGTFRRFLPAYPVDDPGHLAQVLFEPEKRTFGQIGGRTTPSYNSEHSDFFYTTRALVSPTAGVRLPFETPIYVVWSDFNLVADIGVELEDDCIEARFVRNVADRSGWYHPSDAATVASQGLSLVLRHEHNTPLIHEALDEEVARARLQEENEVRSRAQLFSRSPIADWWKERGVEQKPKTSQWDGDYYEPRHWPHFRHKNAEPSTSELETPTQPEPQFMQPPVTKVRSELGYRVAKLLGVDERIRD